MKVEIDDKRLKQLYNLESRCKDIFGSPFQTSVGYVSITCKQYDAVHDLLKPISNRPTLDDLSDVYESAYNKRFSTCTNWTQARVEATVRAVIKVLDNLIDDCSKVELGKDEDLLIKAIDYRDGYKKDIADD